MCVCVWLPTVCIHRTISYYWSNTPLALQAGDFQFFVCPEMLLLKNSDQLSDYRKKNFYNGNAATDAIYSLVTDSKIRQKHKCGSTKTDIAIPKFILIQQGFMCWKISKKIRPDFYIFIKCIHLLSTYTHLYSAHPPQACLRCPFTVLMFL